MVGQTDNDTGVQALAVEINGSTNRPDGSTYHMTWSLALGRKAEESNDVLRAQGFRPVQFTPIRLEPAPP